MDKLQWRDTPDILIMVVLAVTFPFWIILYWVTNIPNKCHYRNHCRAYIKSSLCDKDGGMFYAWDRPGGCYRSLQRYGASSEFYK